MRYVADDKHSAEGKYQFSSGKLACDRILTCLEQIQRGALRTSWFATAGQYSVKYQNCSSVIAWALRQEGADQYIPWPGYFIWHPNNLAFYCEQLAGALGPDARIARPMPAASPAPGLWMLIKEHGI